MKKTMEMAVILVTIVLLLSGCILNANPGEPDDGTEDGYTLGDNLFDVELWGNVAEDVEFEGERAVRIYTSMDGRTSGHRVYTLPGAPVDLNEYVGFTIKYYLKNTLTDSLLLILKTDDGGAFDMTLNATQGEHTVDVCFVNLNKRSNSAQETLNLSVMKTIEFMGLVGSKGDSDWEMYIFEIEFF